MKALSVTTPGNSDSASRKSPVRGRISPAAAAAGHPVHPRKAAVFLDGSSQRNCLSTVV